MIMKKFLILILTFIFTVSGITGQNISLYRKKHNQLLAKQETVHNNILYSNIDTHRYSRMGIYQDDTFKDIPDNYWNSGILSPYSDSEIPAKATISLGIYDMPCKYADVITSPYGWRKRFGRMHKGIDLKANINDTIRAAFDGKVRISKFERGGFGFYLVVRHYNNIETVYAHLSRFLVKPDQYVKAGQPIALSGNTGRSTGPHLHFEIRYMGQAINPEEIFNFKSKSIISQTYTFVKSNQQSKQSVSNTRIYKQKRSKRRAS